MALMYSDGDGLHNLEEMDDRVKLVDVLVEALAVILHFPRFRKLTPDTIQGLGIDVAEADELDHGMLLQIRALHAADATHTDVEDAQLAVLVGERSHVE